MNRQPNHTDPAAHQQTLYLLARSDLDQVRAEPISLSDLWNILWRGKIIILACSVLLAILGIAYALTASEWYRAEIVLAPASSGAGRGLSGQLGGLGTLGNLVGLTGLGLDGAESAEALATLQSDGFTRSFIEQQNLMPILFASRWNDAAGKWKSADPKAQPDLEDALERFERRRRVQEDRKSGLVRLSIEWTDAHRAADWANLLVERLNDRMRDRALTEAETNVAYLRKVLAEENTVVMQQSIGRLLESELQKLMLARGKREFSFQVIDPARPSKWRERPKRTFIVIGATAFGVVLGVLIVLLRASIQSDSRRVCGASASDEATSSR